MVTSLLLTTLIALATPAAPVRPGSSASLYVASGTAVPISTSPDARPLTALARLTPLEELHANARRAPPIAAVILVRRTGRTPRWASACAS